MSMPQYDMASMAGPAPLSGAPPVLELPRKWGPRLALILIVLPLSLGLVLFGGWAAAAEREYVLAAFLGLAGALVFALFAWRMWAEFTRRAALYEEGIELTTYKGSTTLRWAEVEEIFFFAQRIQAGGLLGIALRALIDKIRSAKNIEERGFMINLRILGAGKKLVLNNNDRGVLAAWEQAMARVNPRLIDGVVKRARNGERVSFGKKVTISGMGLAFGSKAEVPWAQIAEVSIQNGALSAKITGKWLRSNAMIATIPNLFVLTAAIVQLSGGSVKMNVQPGVNLAQGVYV